MRRDADTTTEITALAPSEAARFDPAPLERLYAELGPDSAEMAVCQALDALASRLEDAGRTQGVERAAAAMSAVGAARDVGLVSLADAASAAADAAHDPVAAAATLRRLERVADASMAAIWDMGTAGA